MGFNVGSRWQRGGLVVVYSVFCLFFLFYFGVVVMQFFFSSTLTGSGRVCLPGDGVARLGPGRAAGLLSDGRYRRAEKPRPGEPKWGARGAQLGG